MAKLPSTGTLTIDSLGDFPVGIEWSFDHTYSPSTPGTYSATGIVKNPTLPASVTNLPSITGSVTVGSTSSGGGCDAGMAGFAMLALALGAGTVVRVRSKR
ncbi:MAG: Ig-like domain-containing protein [Synergistaceae bacterium]|nr:Ig-like domain-containing protein [Synergistaceae bacterium]